MKITLWDSVSYIFRSQSYTVDYTVLHSDKNSVVLCILYFEATGLHSVLHRVTQWKLLYETLCPIFLGHRVTQWTTQCYSVTKTLWYSVSYILKPQGYTVFYTGLHSESYSMRLWGHAHSPTRKTELGTVANEFLQLIDNQQSKLT